MIDELLQQLQGLVRARSDATHVSATFVTTLGMAGPGAAAMGAGAGAGVADVGAEARLAIRVPNGGCHQPLPAAEVLGRLSPPPSLGAALHLDQLADLLTD